MGRIDHKKSTFGSLGPIIGLTTVILGMVLAIPSTSIIIDSENVFYEVNTSVVKVVVFTKTERTQIETL